MFSVISLFSKQNVLHLLLHSLFSKQNVLHLLLHSLFSKQNVLHFLLHSLFCKKNVLHFLHSLFSKQNVLHLPHSLFGKQYKLHTVALHTASSTNWTTFCCPPFNEMWRFFWKTYKHKSHSADHKRPLGILPSPLPWSKVLMLETTSFLNTNQYLH